MLIFAPAQAQADLSWLAEVTDCASFHQGVTQYFGDLGNAKNMTPEQQHEMAQIIDEACGARFSHCNFNICKNRTAPPAVTSSQFEEGSASSADSIPTDGTTEHAVASTTALTSSIDQSSSIESPQSEDTLAWVNEPLTCEQFRDGIQSRYGQLGKFSQLPPGKKDEVRKVLDLVCSERFYHCNFANCKRSEASLTSEASLSSEISSTSELSSASEINIESASSVASAVDRAIDEVSSSSIESTLSSSSISSVALEEYERKFHAEQIQKRRLEYDGLRQRLKEAQQERIRQAVDEEQSKRLTWERFSIQAEIEARSERVKKEDSSPKLPTSSVPGTYPGTTAAPIPVPPSFPPPGFPVPGQLPGSPTNNQGAGAAAKPPFFSPTVVPPADGDNKPSLNN